MRVLIVVLSLDREPWRGLEQAQRETWADPQPGIEYLHLRGTASSVGRSVLLGARKFAALVGAHHRLDRVVGRVSALLPVQRVGGVLRTHTPEYWIGTSAKTRAGLRYIARHLEFDYLVRTNSSTYINLPPLLEHLSHAKAKGYYAGADQGERHAQGTCIILSHDVVCAIARDRSWDFDTVDDAAIGLACARAGFTFKPLPQVQVTDASPPRGHTSLPTPFIFRIKTRGRRNEDVKAMLDLHRQLHPELGMDGEVGPPRSDPE